MLLIPAKNNRPSHKVQPIEAGNKQADLMPSWGDGLMRG
jgi:hypothetical protein